MKINSSVVQMASDYSAWEGEQMTLASRGGTRSREAGSRLAGAVMGDSVSLMSKTTGQRESTFSYTIHGESRVRQAGDDSSESSAGQSMTQRLVSGVVGREVTLTEFESRTAGRQAGAGGWSAVASPGSLDTFAWVRETRVHFESEQVGFSALGQVKTSDGREIDFQLDLSMDRTMTTKTRQDALIRSRSVTMTDPLVISLDGSIPRLSDARFEFDLDADGESEQISFVSKGSGFLAFDKNGDGRINDGSELFGPDSGDGFTDLSVYDQDQNGWIDENDEVFGRLSVWTRDSDGKDSLVSLKEAGVGAVFLGSAATSFDLKSADGTMKGEVAASGLFLFEDGGVGAVQEINLATGHSREDGSEIPALDDTFDPLNLWAPVAPLNWGIIGNSGKDAYKDLQDNIEALKEQLRQLLDSRRGAPGSAYGSLYRASTPDRANFLMPKGSSFSSRTSIISSSPVTSNM